MVDGFCHINLAHFQALHKTLLSVKCFAAANAHPTKQRFGFKQQTNLATARQTKGFGLEI